MFEKKSNMVEVCGARKRYGQTMVLNGLSMTIPRGIIYGLLGPSGCGKTTLLSCIVGQKYLDSGSISLGVNKKKQIGYMPQEIALFSEFRIDEIFSYFGRLFGIKESHVRKRLREVSKILELPPNNRIISSLSGGQQRRVSFAVTLLHNPKLLILDEPTVGLDPLLCYNVWQFMLRLTHEHEITIIITTHYIEEARHSHMIGLLREGVLLVEESPDTLVASHNSSSLEEVFLNLSKKQQYCRDFRETDNHDNNNIEETKQPVFVSEGSFKYYRFMAQLQRNIKWSYRNLSMLWFMLTLPVLQSWLYCSTFGTAPSNLSVAIVSEEFPNLDICDQISFNVTYSSVLGCDVPVSLTCQYINWLSKKTTIMKYNDVSEAKSAVKRNEVWGVLYINGNFTDAFLERISSGISTADVSLEQSVISVWLDMTDYIVATYLRTHIIQSLEGFIKDILEICGLNPNLGNIPIRMNDAIYGKEDDSGFRISGLPGFLCSFTFYLPLTFTAGAIMMDKKSGNIERSMVAGLTHFEMIVAHMLVQFVLATAQTVLMMVISYIVYPNDILGDVPTIVFILFSVMILGIVFGFLLAAIMPDDSTVAYAGIGIILSVFLISGMIWPSEGTHILLKSWAKGFPVVASIHSYFAVTVKGFTISHPIVYWGIIGTWSWIIILSFVTGLAYKYINK